MSVDQPDERPDETGGATPTGRLLIGGLVIGLLGVGWFVLSHFVMDTTVPDAIGEALGVAFGLLVAVSFVGALASARGDHR